jgi:hypothetical protein
VIARKFRVTRHRLILSRGIAGCNAWQSSGGGCGESRVAQPLLAVRFCRLDMRDRFNHDCKKRTGKSACATKTRAESTSSVTCEDCATENRLGLHLNAECAIRKEPRIRSAFLRNAGDAATYFYREMRRAGGLIAADAGANFGFSIVPLRRKPEDAADAGGVAAWKIEGRMRMSSA